MAKKKSGGFVDRMLHPEGSSDAERDQDQQSEEPASAPKSPKARKSGRAEPAEDYGRHPKFAKFKGRT